MPRTNATTARELARLSSDCSFLLSHLIRQNDNRSDNTAKRCLESILDLQSFIPNPILKATPVGWYSSATNANIYNPISRRFDGSVNSKAVCFTESTLAGLKAHRDIFNVKYGLAFDRDLLFKRGANPCINIKSTLLREPIRVDGEQYTRSVFNFVPSQLHPFVNIIHGSFDATHEREWRHPGDLSFDYNDIFFVFCPAKDFSIFSNIQAGGRPILFDLKWLDRI